MDKQHLPDQLKVAGAEYYTSLRRLGFDPDVLFWAFDRELDEFALILVSPAYDEIGPLAISKVLFRAYEASITPKEISPFVVRLFSPRQSFWQAVSRIISVEMEIAVGDGSYRPLGDQAMYESDDFLFRNDWFYARRERSSQPLNMRASWRKFERNVEQLAA